MKRRQYIPPRAVYEPCPASELMKDSDPATHCYDKTGMEIDCGTQVEPGDDDVEEAARAFGGDFEFTLDDF